MVEKNSRSCCCLCTNYWYVRPEEEKENVVSSLSQPAHAHQGGLFALLIQNNVSALVPLILRLFR